MRWYATILTAAILSSAGCTQTGTDDGGDGGNGTPPPQPLLTVSLTDAPAEATAGQEFTVRWRVDSTEQRLEIPHTGVHWAATSAPEVGPGTGPEAYGGNTAGARATVVPGNFDTQTTIHEQGTIYLRAHAVAQSRNYWSNEITIQIAAGQGDGGSTGTTHTVDMVSTGPGGYTPSPLTVQVGDSVRWRNVDGIAHTATSNTDDFDTGNVAAGATSSAIVFDTPGTYDYHCVYHSLMSGRVVVEG